MKKNIDKKIQVIEKINEMEEIEDIDEIIQEEIEKMNEIVELLKNDIKEFWKSEKALAQGIDSTSTTLETNSNNSIRQSHPLAYRTSRLLDFTKELNEILDEISQNNGKYLI